MTPVNDAVDPGELIAVRTDPCAFAFPIQVERHRLEVYRADRDRRYLAGATRQCKVSIIKSYFTFLPRQAEIADASVLFPYRLDIITPAFILGLEGGWLMATR